MNLILFDIDGTLMHTHGVGRRSVAYALQTVLGYEVDTSPVSFSGKTDPQIFSEILEHEGTSDRDALLPVLLRVYESEMHRAMPMADVTVLPGARQLVERCHADPRAEVALLTGNIEPMAFLKVEAAGLGRFFEWGAFASDCAARNDLPTFALDQHERRSGERLEGARVCIIGDTPYDTRCAQTIGAYTVTVTTGNYTADQLAEDAPDHILDSLRDAWPLLDTWMDG
jgi:phosphoglycolate phosphatase-like HAD superfamily hydrolase